MDDAVKNVLVELNKVRHVNSPYVFTTEDGAMIKGTRLQYHFKQACRKTGLTDVVFHTLRHSAASFTVQAGVDLYIVQNILGHKAAAMIQRYAHIAPENVRAAVNRLKLGTAIPVVDRCDENS